MPTLNADFSKISSSFEPLPKGDYECVVEDIEDTKTRENQLPMLVFHLRVDDPKVPEREGFPLRDFVTLATNKGQPNRIGLGRVKAYAEAVGLVADGSAIDTDEIKGQKVLAVVTQRVAKRKDENGKETEETVIFNDVQRVLPIR